MDAEEFRLRHEVVRVAESWLNTPFYHHGRTKGVGVDCAQFVWQVYKELGLTFDLVMPDYHPQFFLHSEPGEQRFLKEIESRAHRVDFPQMGDIGIWQYGKQYAHGAIFVKWPALIHAYAPHHRVERGRADKGALRHRPCVYYSRW